MIRSVEIEDLAVARGERLLFSRLSARVAAGEALALTGANGAGKTSLLRAIAGLLTPLAGAVRFEAGDGALDAEDARRGGMHLLGHLDGLKSGRLAGEELRFQVRWLGGSDASAGEAAARLDLTPVLQLPVRALSAGQRRRLALARLVAAPRSLWLLDEPLSPLDAARRAQFAQIMAAHLAGGGLIIAAVHDPLPIEARVLALTA
ncbi:MAG TPA: heme ABC exporter ATP-binding protein CcmA [Caulobacteraceae bacterium]|jgi:heme exporter protein A|nr:heme ABC exporter ATP-binding protein CcmA [Caulobacteraceae bacterium]